MIQIARAHLEQLRAHASQVYPNECCGALLGEPGQPAELSQAGSTRVREIVACENAAAKPSTGYKIADEDLARIQRESRARGLQICGFYHSHPDHPADPSASDLSDPCWTGHYVITSVSADIVAAGVAPAGVVAAGVVAAGVAKETKSYWLFLENGTRRLLPEELQVLPEE